MASLDSALVRPQSCLGYRHCLMFLGLCGLAICYIMRIAPGIAIIAMVNSETKPSVHTALSGNTTYVSYEKKFPWTPMAQNTILSSFFYSYFVMQLPAGMAVQYTGGKWTFALGVSMCGLIAICIPKLVEIGGFSAFLVLRLLQGLFQGLCYPSLHRLAGNWYPPQEYSFLSGTMHSGYFLGSVIALLASGFLIDASGWPLPFYLSGLLAFVWLPAWVLLIAETPRTHPCISREEKRYIEQSLQTTRHTNQRSVPWRQMIHSGQIWLVMACYVMDGWANYTLLVCVPQYMDSVLRVPINENGFLSSLPYIAAIGFVCLITPIDGIIVRRQLLSMPNARKMWSALSAFGKAILLLTIAYLDASYKTTIIALLILNVMLSSATLLGFNLANLDLAPPFAGLLFSVFNACSTFSGIVSPLVVGAFTMSYPAAAAWRNVLVLSSAISCLCGVIYVLFAKQAPLEWLTSEQTIQIIRDDGEEDSTDA